MLRIIELDVEPVLSADTGVFEVAWVEYPAIEQELIYFGKQKFYKAPEEVARVACKAIKENEERGNPAATQVGKVRGQQLCNRDEISLETVKRMKSYLERAATYNSGNWDDKGTISYGLWGGEPALRWVDRILKEVEEKEENFVQSAGGFSVGDYVSWNFAGRAEGDDRARGQIKELRIQGEVQVPNTDFTLNATEEEPVALIETASGTIVGQYVRNLRKIQKPENFVYPNAGETRDEYISRCVAYNMDEGKEQEQALAICISIAEEEFALGDKVSFDWDGTLATQRGKELLEQELRRGSIIYIVSARNTTPAEVIELSLKYRIPGTNIFMTGNNRAKVAKVKELGIKRHYDNNPEVIKELGNVGLRFDYDTTALPTYNSYPDSGATDSMLVKPILEPVLFEECGCNTSKEEFEIVGYIDGYPVFKTPEEAEEKAKELGCTGHHTHQDEEGNEIYMPCEVHPENFSLEEDELKVREILEELKETDVMQFEAVVNQLARGFTREEVLAQNHNKATKYFQYKRVINRSAEDREFCTSIEGRFFRRLQIDLLRDYNTEFGHNREPYSKWLYKGGPNCFHAWSEFVAQEQNLVEVGLVGGLPGTPPMNMPNNGYYSEKTKRASEVAYIVSQGYSKEEYQLEGELKPLGFYNGFPYYEDPMLASDASYYIGCGGITEEIMVEGYKKFQACSSNMKKAEMQKQMFKGVEEKRMIYTPLMIPNILIPRYDDATGERYFVKFLPEVIEKIQNRFMIEMRLRDTNLEHTNKKFQDVVMVESWIVSGESDKAYEVGFTKEQIPLGTWMGGYKILETTEGDEVWNKYIKTGKVKGASVEGNFLLNFSREKMDDYLLEQVINILKNTE